MVSRATAVPRGLLAKVECVEPQGNTCGLIYRSLAQMPARGFRPLVMALPKTTTSGVMPILCTAFPLGV